MYHVSVQRDGFATFSALIEIRSALPTQYPRDLSLAPLRLVTVSRYRDVGRSASDERDEPHWLGDAATPTDGVAWTVAAGPRRYAPTGHCQTGGASASRGRNIRRNMSSTDCRSPITDRRLLRRKLTRMMCDNILTAGCPEAMRRKFRRHHRSGDGDRQGLHGNLVAAGSFGTAAVTAWAGAGSGRNTLSATWRTRTTSTASGREPPAAAREKSRLAGQVLTPSFRRRVHNIIDLSGE